MKLRFVAVLLAVAIVFTMAAVVPQLAVHDRTDGLKLIHVVFRHGVRTPADTYPNDVYANHTFHPYGWGQLTNKGKLEQFNSGVFLRKRYDQFLGKIYSPFLMSALSTDSDRAIMSGSLTLAGLWPTKETELEWNPDLNWSPIPIRSQPLSEDAVIAMKKNCPRYYEELSRVMKSDEVQRDLKENEKLFSNLSTITGMSITTPDDVQSLYNTLLAEKEYGLELPSWTQEYYPDKLIPQTELSFILNAYNDELKRLKGGVLLKKIINDWTTKEQNMSPSNKKLFLISGHDFTVTNLLSALGVWERQIPVYGIMILLELYEDITGEYGVEIYLRNSTEVEPFLLTINGCSPRCPLTKVIELTKHIIPSNWDEECKSEDPNYKPPPPTGP